MPEARAVPGFLSRFQSLAVALRLKPRGARFIFSSVASILAALLAVQPGHCDELPDGFVHLETIDRSIRQDIRYAGSANFLGRPARGYDAPACILTAEAAAALSKAQDAFRKDGLTLVVFDCYRPARAVADFVAWTQTGGPPDPQWHPRVARSDLIAKGYVGAQSSHSRGSTVDVALASLDARSAVQPSCGAPDAGILDFGSGFDCFDGISQTAHAGLPAIVVQNRARLVDAMRRAGFRNYSREWWHFTLKAEPFAEKRFDFPVTAP